MKNPFTKRLVADGAGRAAGTAASVAAPAEPNPYVEARREWNERYGSYIAQAAHWRLAALISGFTALACVAGLAWIGAQSRIVPYVVEVDKLGEVRAAGVADTAQAVDPRVIKYALGNFITWWRSLTTDRVVQKDAIRRLYAMLPVDSAALKKLNEQYRATNPFKEAEQQTRSVQLTAVLPISGQTWQVEWTETIRDTRGEMQTAVRYKATLIVSISPPTSEGEVSVNPLGVYVSDVNWTQEI